MEERRKVSTHVLRILLEVRTQLPGRALNEKPIVSKGAYCGKRRSEVRFSFQRKEEKNKITVPALRGYSRRGGDDAASSRKIPARRQV